MTFDQYLANGGDREEKLVTIYKVQPDKLSKTYRSVFDALTCGVKTVEERMNKAFPDLAMPLYEWETIRSDLTKQGADFV